MIGKVGMSKASKEAWCRLTGVTVQTTMRGLGHLMSSYQRNGKILIAQCLTCEARVIIDSDRIFGSAVEWRCDANVVNKTRVFEQLEKMRKT